MSGIVRVSFDIETDDPSEIKSVLKRAKDSVADHVVDVILPALGRDSKEDKAHGTVAHEHDTTGDCRWCRTLQDFSTIPRDDA